MKFFKQSTTPKWAKPLSEEEFTYLRDKLLHASSGRLDIYKADKSGALQHDTGVATVQNLISVVVGKPQNERDIEIERWARVMTQPPQKLALKYPDDIALLRLQLYPVNHFGPGETHNVITRPGPPGTLITLVVDTPDSVFTLSAEDNPGFLKHKDEVISRLTSKLKKDPAHHFEHIIISKDGEMIALIEDKDIMTATHSLVLADVYPQLVGKNGALVGIPGRHDIVVKRLDSEIDAKQAAMIKQIILHAYSQSSPYSLSPGLYHYEEGKFNLVSGE